MINVQYIPAVQPKELKYALSTSLIQQALKISN